MSSLASVIGQALFTVDSTPFLFAAVVVVGATDLLHSSQLQSHNIYPPNSMDFLTLENDEQGLPMGSSGRRCRSSQTACSG
jgi:hypothetical protein